MHQSDELLLGAFADYAQTLSTHEQVPDVLDDLVHHAASMLGAAGAGVTLAEGSGRLRFATATTEPVARLEHTQEVHQVGPCHEAYETLRPVVVADIETSQEWPSYRSLCLEENLRSVAGIPMVWKERSLGALDIYRADPGPWTGRDVMVASLLADMATTYVAHASQLDESRRLNDQLQEALDSRVVIEQAKGLLAGERNISLDQAFEILRRQARNNQASLRAVAHGVVVLGLRP